MDSALKPLAGAVVQATGRAVAQGGVLGVAASIGAGVIFVGGTIAIHLIEKNKTVQLEKINADVRKKEIERQQIAEEKELESIRAEVEAKKAEAQRRIAESEEVRASAVATALLEADRDRQVDLSRLNEQRRSERKSLQEYAEAELLEREQIIQEQQASLKQKDDSINFLQEQLIAAKKKHTDTMKSIFSSAVVPQLGYVLEQRENEISTLLHTLPSTSSLPAIESSPVVEEPMD